MKEEKIGKTDVQIAEIKNDVSWIKRTFERFYNNEFKHLQRLVEWVICTVIIGTLLSIAVSILLN